VDVAPFDAQVPGVDILLEFWKRFRIPASTERTLIVGKFHQDDRGISIAHRQWVLGISAYHLIGNFLRNCFGLLSVLLYGASTTRISLRRGSRSSPEKRADKGRNNRKCDECRHEP